MLKQFQTALTFDDVLLVPQYSDIQHRSNVDISAKLHKNLVLDIPFISANMDTVTESKMAIAMAKLGGLGIIHRFLTIQEEIREVEKVKKKKLKVGAAIGVKSGELERAKALIKIGVDVISLDIAHAHSKMAGDMLGALRKMTRIPIIAGTVATADGVEFLCKKGADIIKVGIGAGSACITRLVSGTGVPQITAIMESAKAARKYKIPIVADAGMKIPADVVKAIGAGAHAIMSGNIFAGCDETPGKIIIINGKKYKPYRGMASLAANLQRTDKTVERKNYVAEGVNGLISYKGSVQSVITEFSGGLRSGLSYSGAHNILEFHKKAKFVQVTPTGLKENGSHDMQIR
jgi:IMP dehydrogenase